MFSQGHMSPFGIFLMLATLQSVCNGYDHTAPPGVLENFDPDQADPWGNIKCYGPPPPFTLSSYTHENTIYYPDTFTLQQLCAKPEYGGMGPYQHLGGFCQRYNEPFDSMSPWDPARDSMALSKDKFRPIAFDTSRIAKPMPSKFARVRMFQYCQQRCFCDFPTGESSPTPPQMIYAQLRSHIVDVPADNPDVQGVAPIALDRDHTQSTRMMSYISETNRGGYPQQKGLSARVLATTYMSSWMLREYYYFNPTSRESSLGWHMNLSAATAPPQPYPNEIFIYGYEGVPFTKAFAPLDPANEITCNGDTPIWHWWRNINPYPSWQMDNEMFWRMVGAITDDQGSYPVLGNLPVYPFTDRSQLPITTLQQLCPVVLSGGNPIVNAGGYCHRNPDGVPTVWFTDEMTPHVNLTYDSWAKSNAIRGLCKKQCTCTNLKTPEKADSRTGFYQLTVSTGISETFENNLQLTYEKPNDGVGKPVGSKATGRYTLPGAANGDQCSTDEAPCDDGPWPTDILGERPSTPVLTPTINFGTCGNTCTSNRDCGSSTAGGCRCVVPKLVALDPVFPVAPTFDVARCLAIGAILGSVGFGKHKREFTGNRNTTSVNLTETFGRNVTLSGSTTAGDLKNMTEQLGKNISQSGNSSLHFVNEEAFNGTLNQNITATSPAPDGPALEIVPANDTGPIPFPADLPKELIATEAEAAGVNDTIWFNETAPIKYDQTDLLESYLFCACNCTYVSLSCCNAVDGIVHESPASNMGSLTNCTLPPTNTTLPSSPVISKIPEFSMIASRYFSANAKPTAVAMPQPVCRSTCYSVARQCEVGCSCSAPQLSIFFWFSGRCQTPYVSAKNPKRQAYDGGPAGARNTSFDIETGASGLKSAMNTIANGQLPAPCNESYVSFACATSTDGIVHEAPEMWLGAILPDNQTATLPPIPANWLQIHGLAANTSSMNRLVSTE